MTKKENIVPQEIERVEDSPQVEQRKILKRLKRIEDRMKKRDKRKKREINNE